MSEMIGEINRIQKLNKAKEKLDEFLKTVKRKQKAREKQEDFIPGQELRKVEREERQKEEVYEIIFNLIRRK